MQTLLPHSWAGRWLPARALPQNRESALYGFGHRGHAGAGPLNLPSISVAHYGEQNGDLMRDRRCASSCPSRRCAALSFRPGTTANDYMGVEQYSRYRDGENYVFLPDLYEQHGAFARQWDRNLRAQGFLEAFTDKSIRG